MKHLIKSPKVFLILAAVGIGLLAQPVYAHGFGLRYSLPIPLGYFMIGAGATVALSFVVIGLFVRANPGQGGYWRHDLFKRRWLRAVLTNPFVTWPVKAAPVFLLGLVIATGLAGSQTPSLNFSPTFVWVLWWVGMGFVAALVGNLWALINPWKTLYEWAEWVYARTGFGKSLSLNKTYPRSWGIWPAIIIFLLFAWLENAFAQSDLPRNVAIMALVYSAITLGGMIIFGKHRWLQHGEAFSVVFGFLSRFSPTEVRVRDPEICRACGEQCEGQDGDCIDCYRCFEEALSAGRAEAGTREAPGTPPGVRGAAPGMERPAALNIRPFAIGLARPDSYRGAITNDRLVMVILLLSTVTFDGLSATPAWSNVQSLSLDTFSGTVNNVVFNGLTIADTIGLALIPVVFLLVYLAFSYLMAQSVDSVDVDNESGVGELARAFIYPLIPIALAYNIAHFLTLLLIQGQLIIPLASDPFGFGWDLFGTSERTVNIGIIGAKALWFLSVSVIVLGHIIAVYLSHLISMRLFADRRTAMRSQYPIIILMVMYTVVSLWIVAQPIAD